MTWNYEDATTGGGYTCASCGVWVAVGTAHGCQWTALLPWNPQPTFVFGGDLTRIAEALERIADALERHN